MKHCRRPPMHMSAIGVNTVVHTMITTASAVAKQRLCGPAPKAIVYEAAFAYWVSARRLFSTNKLMASSPKTTCLRPSILTALTAKAVTSMAGLRRLLSVRLNNSLTFGRHQPVCCSEMCRLIELGQANAGYLYLRFSCIAIAKPSHPEPHHVPSPPHFSHPSFALTVSPNPGRLGVHAAGRLRPKQCATRCCCARCHACG